MPNVSFSENASLGAGNADPNPERRLFRKTAFLLMFLLFSAAACGNGAPSDAQIARVLKQDFKKLEKTALAFTEAELQDIRIGEKRKAGSPGAYKIHVTATVATRIGGMNTVRPCAITITMKKANNRWTLVD